MKHLVVLSGAGVSAESGLRTFRDADGLWEGHDVMEVASPQGWYNDQDLVLDFYNQRRRQLLEVRPNHAHEQLAALEKEFEIDIITQNVDDLHERAGSSRVTHLHGELLKVRSSIDESLVFDWRKDLVTGDKCPKGSQLRPHIVWFGEQVPMMDEAIQITAKADLLLIVGTSMQVYPAASLMHYAKPGIPMYYLDPNPAMEASSQKGLKVIPETAVNGIDLFIESIRSF